MEIALELLAFLTHWRTNASKRVHEALGSLSVPLSDHHHPLAQRHGSQHLHSSHLLGPRKEKCSTVIRIIRRIGMQVRLIPYQLELTAIAIQFSPFGFVGFVRRQLSLLENLLRRQNSGLDLKQLLFKLESPSVELVLRDFLLAYVSHEFDHALVTRRRRDASVSRHVLHDGEIGTSLVRQTCFM